MSKSSFTPWPVTQLMAVWFLLPEKNSSLYVWLNRSTLFHTSIMFLAENVSLKCSSSRIFNTDSFCNSFIGLETSLKCMTRSACDTSYKVDLKDSTNSTGKSVMNPIVSSRLIWRPDNNFTLCLNGKILSGGSGKCLKQKIFAFSLFLFHHCVHECWLSHVCVPHQGYYGHFGCFFLALIVFDAS